MNYDKVWYGGKIINAKDLPSDNFNSPLKVTAELTSVWDEVGVTWFNRLQWNGVHKQRKPIMVRQNQVSTARYLNIKTSLQ